MHINVHTKNINTKHISILGELESKDDIAHLINLLEYTEHKLHITFFDASILPSEIIDILISLQESNKIKVYVFKRFLYSYLTNLGIKCNYIENKSLMKLPETKILNMSNCELNNITVKIFLGQISEKYGYDYTDYQIESIKRRIKICMLRENIIDFNDFRNIVLNNEDIFEQLFLAFSINTTDFFRDPEVFSAIKNRILPYLNSYSHIKIWCVGCSNGKEPYSLAILLKEAGLLDKTQIYATDINPYVIEEAKNGLFSINTLESDIINYSLSGGTISFIDYFKLKGQYIKASDELKKNILFFQHSLVSSGILNEFQLILCRNVLIYFNSYLQKKVLDVFYHSLDMSGFLILGKSEGILQNEGYKLFNKYQNENKIYRRKE